MANTTAIGVDSKEIYSVIQQGLPGIYQYIKVVLKKEKLSDEAESKRQKYELILTSLEQGNSLGGRPCSFVCEDDNGYIPTNRNRVGDIVDQPKAPLPFNHSGYLLWQDDKMRWRRSWCRAEYRDMRLYIYEDNNEEILLRSFSLENTSTHFDGQVVVDTGKDNSFVISEVLYDALGGSSGNEMEASTVPVDVHFAAYTDSECKKWKDILLQLSSRDSVGISFSIPDGNSWLPNMAHDSTSSSSSNLGSNRDSMISNTSSLVNTHRMSSKSDLGEGKDHGLPDDPRILSVSKQQQPLPSPPHQIRVRDDDCISNPDIPTEAPYPQEDDDTISVGTIYESIDNLVLQFDDAIREIGENMKSGGGDSSTKKQKKKDRSIFRQHSFLSSRRSSKSKLLSEKKAELEKGERYSGYMLKKNNSGSWKRKWCVLKGCVFGYYKSRGDGQGHEYVLLNGEVCEVQENKKNFTFCLHCKGVPEMYFSLDEEEVYLEWLSKLHAACNSAAEYADALQTGTPNTDNEVQAIMDESSKFVDSIYNVPRTASIDVNQLYDTPRGNPTSCKSGGMTSDAAIDAGIYNVPRSLMLQPPEDSKSPSLDGEGNTQYLLGTNPLDIYDYPRASMSPDEEGIYDDPLDIIDMEIYDYPPDANDIIGENLESNPNTTRNSTVTMSSEYPQTDRESANISYDSWSTLNLPPLPRSARPFLTLSVGSNSDENQSCRNSAVSGDMVYDHPRTHNSYGDVSGVMMSSADNVTDSLSNELSDTSALEYGQCALRGSLFKKEKFTWVKLFCIIRNNFLECHKSHGDFQSPNLKLFLPGSEVKEVGGDAKKKWTFQVKHPRRDGVLTFAADSEEDCRRWIKAFQSGASIQVQPVKTVEEIRITDLEMKKRWTSLDKDGSSQFTATPQEDMSVNISSRRKTFSAGNTSEDYASDTLKRRRKFSWVKSNFMRRKTEKKIISGSQTDLNSNRLSTISFDINPENSRVPHPNDPLRKSVSLELLPTSVESDENLQSKMTQEGSEQFQGYLRVQRKGADNVWVRYWCILEDSTISCYISQRDLTLTLSIQLQGSRVAEAELECQRRYSFKVFHVESGQCLYFAADDHSEFFRWFSQITQGGEQVVSDDSTGPFLTYYVVAKDGFTQSRRLSILSEGGSSNVSEGSTTTLPVRPPGNLNGALYRGELMKSSHTGKWKRRYCIVKDGYLNVYRSSTDKSPVTSITLHGCSLELVSTLRGSQNEFQFKLNPTDAGKCHTFAAPSETEMYTWVSALRDASYCKPSSVVEDQSYSPIISGKSSLRRKNKKLKDADLITSVPASSITDPDHSGFANVQYGTEPWTKYWCIAYSNCLYIYQDQASELTVKTVVLPGYEVKIKELNSTKYLYNLSLTHEGVSPVRMALKDQDELDNWVKILGKFTRVEGANRQSKSNSKLLPDEAPKVLSHKISSKSVAANKKKGPMKADHTIKIVTEEGNESSPGPSSTSKEIEFGQNLQDIIIHRYEKRIRKTHKVANQTEQKLKKQQTSLLHFKKELSRHVVKLQELSDSGDRHAQKRLKNVRIKLTQLDKIVPYLGKYVTVNRQAEMQTVAVLKESCTMELMKVPNGSSIGAISHVKDSRFSVQSAENSSSLLPPLNEKLQPSTSSEELQQSVMENPYASLSEVRNEAASNSVKLRSNYAELDFQKNHSGSTVRPPSIQYSEVRIDSLGLGKIATTDVDGNQHVTLNDKSPQEAPNHKCISLSATVQSNEHEAEESNISLHNATLTPENAALFSKENSTSSTPIGRHCVSTDTPLVQSISPIPGEIVERGFTSFNQMSPKAELSPPPPPLRSDSISHGSHNKKKSPPPPVAKKPNSRQSPVHKLPEQSSNLNHERHMKSVINENPEQSSSDSVLSLQGTPSVVDRIKALQHQ